VRAAFFIALAGTLLWCTAATAQNTQDDMHWRSVERLLNAARGFPTQKQIHRTGKATDTNRILSIIVTDASRDDRLRLNAIRALEYFPTMRTKNLLMGQIYAKKQRIAYIRACMRALARAFGTAIYFDLMPFIQDPRAAVRSGAVIALGEIDDDRVRGILSNHLSHEKEIFVRQEIEKTLDVIKKRNEEKRKAEKRRRLGGGQGD
jgi:HEAT repeat protein